MQRYEYKVVPAPTRGEKARGVKTPEGRFALSVQSLLNRMGADGWEYLRAELLPSEERSGLTGSATKWRNVLVFRRTIADDLEAFEPELIAPPAAIAEAEPTRITAEDAPEPAPEPEPEGEPEPEPETGTDARFDTEDEDADDTADGPDTPRPT